MYSYVLIYYRLTTEALKAEILAADKACTAMFDILKAHNRRPYGRNHGSRQSIYSNV